MPDQEVWKSIPGFPGYEVSDLGRVMSHRSWRGRPGPRELQGVDNGNGYRIVAVTGEAGVRRRYVHHLVAEAFYGPRPAGLEIRHLDGDQANNAASNLRYGTPVENQADRVLHGTHEAGRSHCRNGHLYTSENTAYFPSMRGKRCCLTCKRSRENATNAARRAA